LKEDAMVVQSQIGSLQEGQAVAVAQPEGH
jgi:hypothetical protein